jgi:hypothetical protein
MELHVAEGGTAEEPELEEVFEDAEREEAEAIEEPALEEPGTSRVEEEASLSESTSKPVRVPHANEADAAMTHDQSTRSRIADSIEHSRRGSRS